MRRTFTTITALGAALALAACNGDNGGTDTATDPETAAVETTDETTDETTGTDDDATTAGADDDATTAGTDEDGETAAAGGMSDPVCAEFFETQGTPLDERTEEQLEVVASGDELDPVSFSEVNLLNGRISKLIEEADGEHADLLERINAPFDEVVESVTAEDAGQEPEIAIPDVDTDDSEAALEEFETACAS